MLKVNFRLLKILSFTLLLISYSTVFSQKVIEKSWDSSSIHSIQVESDAVFLISVVAEPTKTLALSTKIEGEYYENVMVRTKIVDGTLQISTGFSPYFKKDDDKLAAHKVISIEMNLKIPENKSVDISSLIASVEGRGNFKDFKVNLTSGMCSLTSFLGHANLKTMHGYIMVSAKKGIVGDGNSTYGKVQNFLPKAGSAGMIIAKSVYGDIVLKQTQ